MPVRGIIAVIVAMVNAGNNTGISRGPLLGLKVTGGLPDERIQHRSQNVKPRNYVRARPELRRRHGAR